MANILVNYLGENGAGPVFSLELAKGLAQNGHDVYGLVSSRSLNLEDWKNEPCFKKLVILDTYSSKKDYLLHLNKYTGQVARKCKELLGEIEMDCVIRTFPHPMLKAAEKQLQIKKNITFCHDPLNHSGEPLSAKVRNRMYMKQAEEVIVLTRSFIPIITNEYGITEEHVHFMPHGMMAQYREKQNKNPLVCFDENKVNYVFFGRIEDYKGIPILLKAFQRLEEKYDNITLTIAGKGNIEKYQSDIDKITNITVINRYISDEEVGTLFDSESVVAVIPYVDATQSGVIPIALEYGNSIVATATGGLKEQLDDGRIGLFAKPGDIEDLAEQMEKAMDSSLRSEQGILGQEFAKTLSWKEVTKVITNIVSQTK